MWASPLRSIKPASLCLVGSLRTPRQCPPSVWNAVRLQRGIVSAITAECCPPSARNGVRHRVEYARVMNVRKIAAFSADALGGNPAGVVVADALPAVEEMQSVAADVGFSETVFSAPTGRGWRVRYFSPKAENPFCGHATIALGAVLADQGGAGTFRLCLNHAEITVEGYRQGDKWGAALQSPPTRSQLVSGAIVADAMG